MDIWFALEWSAALLSLAAVACMAGRRRIGFPLNILASFLYLLVFRHSGLLGDAFLQLWFAAWLIYGWFHWKKLQNQDHRIQPRRLNRTQLLRILAAWGALSLMLGFWLSGNAAAAFPWPDGFCVAGSLIAQVLQSRGYTFNWLMWMIIDLVYIPLYLFQQLYPTAVLYGLFLVLALMAWRKWQKVAGAPVAAA